MTIYDIDYWRANRLDMVKQGVADRLRTTTPTLQALDEALLEFPVELLEKVQAAIGRGDTDAAGKLLWQGVFQYWTQAVLVDVDSDIPTAEELYAEALANTRRSVLP